MEIKDWLLLGSMVIVTGGWFVNSYFNRKNEIAKKKLDYRLEALTQTIESLLDIRNLAEGKSNISEDKISKAHFVFQLYANKDELKMFDNCIENLTKENIQKLIFLLRRRIRAELDLPYFKLKYE